MDSSLQTVLERAMRDLTGRLGAENHLEPELVRARREFFGEAAAITGRGVAEATERRFGEWFALERESETLGGVPAALPRFAVDEALLGSVVSVFAVTSSQQDSAFARDLQDDAILELTVPADALEAGDLVVGRLFPAGVGLWLPSVAATVFRPGGALGAAFKADVERLDLDRRLQQIEIEHLLLRQRSDRGFAVGDNAATTAPLEHLEADLERLLGEGGLSATAISEQLAAAARPGPVMGPLLDEIAFDTAVDLDALRRVLLAIWNAHHPETGVADADDAAPDVEPSLPGETLGERMVRKLDEGLQQNREVDSLFADLEQMAGLEPGAADDEENPYDRVAPDEENEAAAGTLDPLVQEFLWETGAENDAARTLRIWVELQGNAAVPHADLEEVTGLDLMRLLMHVYLGAAPERRVEVVRDAFAAVREFFAWAERTQELELEPVLADCRGGLLDHLDRIASAGAALSRGSERGGRPAMLEVVDVSEAGFGVCGEDGDSFWLDLDRDTAALLRVGDIVLGSPASAGGAFTGPVVVLPNDARKLID